MALDPRSWVEAARYRLCPGGHGWRIVRGLFDVDKRLFGAPRPAGGGVILGIWRHHSAVGSRTERVLSGNAVREPGRGEQDGGCGHGFGATYKRRQSVLLFALQATGAMAHRRDR